MLATRLLTLAAAPVTLLLVMTRLAAAEQGVYFIFVNAFALSQLFEIGVGSLVVQYASHEVPHVAWGAHGAIEADEVTLVRIHWMLRRLLRWYFAAAVIVVVVAAPLGLALFTAALRREVRSTTSLWLTTVVVTAAYFPLVPLLNTIEGCGRLIDVQRMRLIQALFVALSSWILIPTVGGLFAVAVNAILQFGIAAIWLSRRYPVNALFGLEGSAAERGARRNSDHNRAARSLRDAIPDCGNLDLSSCCCPGPNAVGPLLSGCGQRWTSRRDLGHHDSTIHCRNVVASGPPP